MDLLCAHVETGCIRLIGCWCSNEMLHYLHLHQAQPATKDIACHRLAGVKYTLIPGQDVPNALFDIPNPSAP